MSFLWNDSIYYCRLSSFAKWTLLIRCPSKRNQESNDHTNIHGYIPHLPYGYFLKSLKEKSHQIKSEVLRNSEVLRSMNPHKFFGMKSLFCFESGWAVHPKKYVHVFRCNCSHYIDVMMGAMASQITSLTIVYWTVYSGADQWKHQSYASLAFVRGIHR